MGLAAVPFGTAQAVDYEIKVTQEYTCDPNDPKSEKDGAMHFKISVGKAGEEPHVADIIWPNDKEYPNPIYQPGKCFLRICGADLRKKTVTIDSILCNRYNDEMNAREWVDFYMPNASKAERVNGIKRAFSYCVEYAEVLEKNVFDPEETCAKILDSGGSKNDFFVATLENFFGNRAPWEEWLKRNKDNILLCPPYNFPESYTCVGYIADVKGGSRFRLYLLREPFGFKCVVISHHGELLNLCISSDVPTVCLGHFNKLCTDNEFLNPSFRKLITDNFFVGHHKYRVKEAGYSLPSGGGTRFFIRQGHRADEIELNDENAAPGKCDYFVQTDPFGEKITDIWEKGKRLNTDDVKDRKFKDPKEIVKFLEEKFGKGEEPEE